MKKIEMEILDEKNEIEKLTKTIQNLREQS